MNAKNNIKFYLFETKLEKLTPLEKIEMFRNQTAILGTMHLKERWIGPILEDALGLKVVVPSDLGISFNTDDFGSFSGVIPRTGNQLEAARAKAKHAMALTPYSIAIASEGSFGPDPTVGLLPCNRELVLLLAHSKDEPPFEPPFEIVGQAMSLSTNFSHQVVSTQEELMAFALAAGFPAHGLLLKLQENSETPALKAIKTSITTEEDLLETFRDFLQACQNQAPTMGSSISANAHENFQNLQFQNQQNRLTIQVETDMRAHMNPTRQKVIEAATWDLVQKLQSLCPQCQWPGFQVTQQISGLPCSACGFPTPLSKKAVWHCQKCHHQTHQDFPQGHPEADPAHCPLCNP
jgi:rubrerythrin